MLTNVSARMTADGQLGLYWDQSRDVFSTFYIYRNGALWYTQKEKNVKFTDLEDGETVNLKLVTYRGISDYRTVFTSKAGNQSTLGAVLVTPGQDSVQIFWTPIPFEIAVNASKLRIELTVKQQPSHSRFFSANEAATRVLERTDPGTFSDPETIDDLMRGVEYDATVRVFSQDGSELNSLTTSTAFYTDPLQLSVESNELRLWFQKNVGLSLEGTLTKFTFALHIHIKATLHRTQKPLIEESSCSLDECFKTNEANGNGRFEFLFFQSESVEPGVQFTVQLSTSSGPFQSQMAYMEYFEEPLPVSDLKVEYFDTETIKLTWNPPSTGYYRAFKIHVSDDTGNDANYMRDIEPSFTAAGLSPGVQYHFSVATTSDADGRVESSPVTITQDTVPLPPHDVTGSQLHKDDDRNFEIVFTEPKNGQWDHFEVTAYETKNIQKSNEGILQDKTIVLPMRLDNAGSFIMYFSHFQTEYTVEICTVNTFGRKSFGSSKVTIITGGVSECEQKGEDKSCSKAEATRSLEDDGPSWNTVYLLTAAVSIAVLVIIALTAFNIKLLRTRRKEPRTDYVEPALLPSDSSQQPSISSNAQLSDINYGYEGGHINSGESYQAESPYSHNVYSDPLYSSPQ
ncbi:fibronectin-like [Convolutriloba macropyga]|uniref:fibronectin-like n=1 Tax=Convolutriloba macropyga TaxID=536237 RepID=UPI003F527BD3